MRKPKDIMPEEITAIKLRHNLGEVLDQVANKHARFLVKRSGIPAAVLMSLQQFPESLEPQSTSRFLVWPFVNLHAIMRLKIHSIAPF